VREDPGANVVVHGEGRPLLLLHGWGASSELFRPVLRPLADGRMLIAPDLPGFGSTPPPRQAWSASEFAQWTLALLDRLHVTQCDVIGHSNGGRIAIVLAANHAERIGKVVLVDSAGVRPKHGLRYALGVRSYKVLRRAENSPLLPERIRSAAQARANRRGSSDYRAASGVMRATLVRLVNEDLTPLLPRIKAPVLLIWGEHDSETPIADARHMEQLIPDCGLVVFENAGHFSYLEQPGRFVRIVDVFLRDEKR
jgi:pimeloyl-ACP methyl ester carboxylesterase